MALCMVALRRTKTGLVARKGIPVDVREPYARLYGVGWEAKLKLPADISKHEAKARHGEWLADVEMRIAALRATAKGEGQPLTRLNAIALAGRWYTWFVGQHEDHPGTPQQWRKLSDHIAWNILRPEAPEEYEENSQADPEWEWAKTPEVRARVRPQIAELARVASFLASAGMALEDKAHTLFVDAVSDNLLPALSLLERRAQGDYTPDTMPESFPAFAESQTRKAQGLNCWQLFEAFVNAVKPAPKTVNRWRAVFLNLQAEFPQTGAAAITEADARAWVNKLTTPKRSPVTVRGIWLSASRRVFGWAETHKHVPKNPFVNIRVDVPRKARTRETEAFTPAEAQVILRAALQYENPKSARDRARRWGPWLCAYSGARMGEITQLRGITQRSPISQLVPT
jgi:hypothetical protein